MHGTMGSQRSILRSRAIATLAGRANTKADSSARKLSVVLICPSNGNAWEEVASINYFLRPADYTENITDLWNKSSTQAKEMDCKFSLKNFLDVTEALTPDLIIFLSHFVCVHAEGDFPKFFPKKELWDWTFCPLTSCDTNCRALKLHSIRQVMNSFQQGAKYE